MSLVLCVVVLQDLGDAYKKFLDAARTPWDGVAYCREQAPEFKPLDDEASIAPGTRWFVDKAGKTALMIVIGKRMPTEGMRIIGAHIDSVRIDLKPTSLYESAGFAMFDTNSYGGIKNYQWVNIPLELRLRVPRSGGAVDRIVIDDAAFVIPDLLPHLDSSLRDRKQTEVIKAEELDPIAGMSLKAVREALAKRGVTEKDLALSEAALVPSMPSRDAGLDRALIAGYGHDDKACSFAAFEAIRRLEGTPEYTCIAYLVEKEETGSTGNTGADSEFLRRIMGRIVGTSEQALRHCLSNTKALSADVTGGLDPIFTSVHDEKNAAKLGQGVAIKRYGRGKDANAEMNRWLADKWDAAGIKYQVTMLGKVDAGGGGTIARFMADDEMDVIDVGIPELSMHSPYSLVARADVEEAVKAFGAFYK